MGIEPRDIVRHMQVPERPGLYVLGTFETRVTVYSQQVRALNLVYSLVREKWMEKGAKVAVVGAGVAGLTAAAAAGWCGADVTVLEQASEPLSLIGRSERRWLHPHIYEWPIRRPNLPDPLEPDAGLPLLNWQAGSVQSVKASLLEQFRLYEEKFGIKLIRHVTDVMIETGEGKRFSLTWNEPANRDYPKADLRSRSNQFDVVILAVGFGLEQRAEGIPFLSYWSSDRLEEEDVSIVGQRKRYLVSGTGDGGLIDLLRLRFDKFSHHGIVDLLTRELLNEGDMQWLTERLTSIEAKAERTFAEGKRYQATLYEDYLKLGDELKGKVDIFSRLPLRTDTQAVLTSRDSHPLSLRTSILNRLLYVILPDSKYMKGPWTSERNDDGTIKVRFANNTSEDFHEIIIRHGPEPALKRNFPDIWEQCSNLKLYSLLDQTRYPIYKDYYRGAPAPAGSAAATATAAAAPDTPSPAPHAAVAAAPPPTATPAAEVTAAPARPAVKSPFEVRGDLPASSVTYLPRGCDEQLQSALADRPLIAISGEFQIGKSSLLNHSVKLLPGDWEVCHFNFQGMRTDNSHLFIAEFFESLSERLGVSNSWAHLGAQVKTQPLALLFDEFGALSFMGHASMAFITNLIWLADAHPERVRVVACLPLPMAQFVKQFDANPKYWQRWHQITVEPFERAEEILPIFDLLPPPAARAARDNYTVIWQLSSRRPNRLQSLCDRLFRAAGEGGQRLLGIITDPESYRP